jgi:probable rRNA maturation factor
MTERPRAARRRPDRARTKLEVVDRGTPRTPRAFLRRVVAAALAHGGRPELPVSLLLTDDREIAALHDEWFGDPAPTDVISFLVDGTAELAVSVATARRVARAHGHAVRAEVALYVVHGLLHVLGHDDTNARARARMRTAEREILAKLGLAVARVDA